MLDGAISQNFLPLSYKHSVWGNHVYRLVLIHSHFPIRGVCLVALPRLSGSCDHHRSRTPIVATTSAAANAPMRAINSMRGPIDGRTLDR